VSTEDVWSEVDTEPADAEFYPLGEHEAGDSVVLDMLSKFRKAEKSKYAEVEAKVYDPTMNNEYILAPTSTHLLSDLEDIDPQEDDTIRLSLRNDGDGAMDRVWSAELL